MILSYLSMMVIVALSNYLVQFPINDWLTLGAFSYPVSFLVTELTNRFYGPKLARQVVYVGFLLGVILSGWVAPLQIAIASGSAFFVSQLLDIYVFNRLRQAPWWQGPFYASLIASLIDTAIFSSTVTTGVKNITFSSLTNLGGAGVNRTRSSGLCRPQPSHLATAPLVGLERFELSNYPA